MLEAAVPGGVPPVNPDAGDMGTSAHINPAAGAHNPNSGHVGLTKSTAEKNPIFPNVLATLWAALYLIVNLW